MDDRGGVVNDLALVDVALSRERFVAARAIWEPEHLAELFLTRAEPGDTPHPDFALETSWQDWIEISMRGQNPLRAIARRRLRPRGSLRGFRAFATAFTPRRIA